VIDVSDLDSTGSTAWTSGVAQVETATAAGTISGSGNASVVVTAAGMTGSPKTISVAVLASDTAATWAGKVRTALAADADVSALFTSGGSTTAISLTRKATSTYTVNGTSVPVYPANDATLNISLDNGTCTGITTAATSANTTAGVLTAGAYCPDLDGTDFEGEATGGMADAYALMVKVGDCESGVEVTQASTLDILVNVNDYFFTGGTGTIYDDDITISPIGTGDASSFVTVTIAGA
jgi:hypothetical protein